MPSREESPVSRALGSHQSTPSAAFHTPSPPALHGFVPSNFNTPASLGHQPPQPNQWLSTSRLPATDGTSTYQLLHGGPTNKGRRPQSQRSSKTTSRQQAPHVFQFGAPQCVPPSLQLPLPPPQCQLIIKPIPTKSRVETQIRLNFILKHPPRGVHKIHLPTHTISKPKLQSRPPPQPSAAMLELSVSLVCTSAMRQQDLRDKALARAAANPQRYLPPPNDDGEHSSQNGAEVRICQNCIGRERKRAARKKVKQADAEKAWMEDEEYRVVVFNTQEVRDLKPHLEEDGTHLNRALGYDAPVRIACYCRHHGEKLGFNMIVTLKDSEGRVVAQGLSDPIMITDDHKTAPLALQAAQTQAQAQVQPQAQAQAQAQAQVPVPARHESVSTVDSAGPSELSPVNVAPLEAHNVPADFGPQAQPPYLVASPSSVFSPSQLQNGGPATRPLSRPASPTNGGPSKKRKSSNSRIPNELTMTKMETSQSPAATKPSTVSPFPAPVSNFPQPEALFSPNSGHGAFNTNPPTPNPMDQNPFNFPPGRSASVDNLALAQLYSASSSNHPSRTASPNGLRPAVGTQAASQMSQALATSFLPVPLGSGQPRPIPMIHKVIPGEGSRVGGIEVTVLGTSFIQGVDIYFGTTRAVTTTYWGENSLVCLLPPSPVLGPVPVTCQHISIPPPQLPLPTNTPMFRYVDDGETHLMRLALQCVGEKTFGTDMDVSTLARRVINAYGASPSEGSGGDTPPAGAMFNQASSEGLELQLLKCLDIIDLDDSPREANLDQKSPSGHTMLHLASSLGFRRLVAGLLARGADPNALDNGHFTPLHIAAVHDQPEIARRLMLAGANPRAYSLSDESPVDLAESGAVIRAIRFSERPARSRSETSLHSRVSSFSSVRSMLEPLSQIRTHDEPLSPGSGSESPEYTSGDFEDEDPDEDSYLSMRRPSRRQSIAKPEREAQGHFDQAQVETDADVMSMANAMGAAFKDSLQQQFHQFQQSMALHLQNLPHMPQIPTLPGRPVLPDYQAYLQQAPFMRRVTQYMPGMMGGRPESPDRQEPKMDHRWWDISSYMGSSSQPPPSYDELFQLEQKMEDKQSMAAQAAAEAEADIKCARIYDQAPSSSTETVERIETEETEEVEDATEEQEKTGVPSVLNIGRKHAITKEQQEQFLRAREARLKRISNDRNLFFIWVRSSLFLRIVDPLLTLPLQIPLLVIMLCAMVYSYVPSIFVFAWAVVQSAIRIVQSKTTQLFQTRPERVVEVG
jgi:hypothetical protein